MRREGAALSAEHDAGAQQADAHAVLLGGGRRLFPGGAERVREGRPPWRFLGEVSLVIEAVEADGRAAHQDRRLAAAPRDEAHHGARRLDAAVDQRAAALRRPSPGGHRLAGEVDDGVEGRVAAERGEIVDERDAAAERAALARIARQHGDAVAGVGEHGAEARADEAGAAGDED